LLNTAIAHQASAAPPPTSPPPPAPTVTATSAGQDLHLTFDTHIPRPAGLVVTVGDPDQITPPAIHRVQVDERAGTVVIPGAAANGQAVHVSVGAEDGQASPAAQATPN
jgi:hypothetical protein